MVHEWALAESIVKTALEYARERGANRVKSVRIVLGELQNIDSEVLSFALENLFRGTIAEDAEIAFEKEKAVFKCRKCGYTWSLDDAREKVDDRIREDMHFIPEVVHSFLSCPKCGSRDFEVISGRGLYIKEIMVE